MAVNMDAVSALIGVLTVCVLRPQIIILAFSQEGSLNVVDYKFITKMIGRILALAIVRAFSREEAYKMCFKIQGCKSKLALIE